MEIKFRETEEFLIFTVEDRLDSLNAKKIMDFINVKLKECENCNKDILFNFENLEYISSAGLQILLACAQNRKELNKKVYIYKPQELVDNVLKVAGFYSFLSKKEDMDDL